MIKNKSILRNFKGFNVARLVKKFL
jgi:hypothetical protein